MFIVFNIGINQIINKNNKNNNTVYIRVSFSSSIQSWSPPPIKVPFYQEWIFSALWSSLQSSCSLGQWCSLDMLSTGSPVRWHGRPKFPSVPIIGRWMQVETAQSQPGGLLLIANTTAFLEELKECRLVQHNIMNTLQMEIENKILYVYNLIQ